MLKVFAVFLLALVASVEGKIYDCFLFFNELDLLEIRLNELYDHVDHFVLLESCESFRGLDKPYYFEKNKERFQQFADKIIHIKFDRKIVTEDPWLREKLQRDATLLGLKGASPDDIVMMSDADEIFPGALIPKLEGWLAEWPIFGVQQRLYRYFLNREDSQLSGTWPGHFVCRYRYLMAASSADELRKKMLHWGRLPMIQAGWHFTSMGGFKLVSEKLSNFSHWPEYTDVDLENWKSEVDKMALVPIDESFPKFVRENVAYLASKGLIDDRQ